MLEDVRLGLTTDPQSEFDLLMAFIEERFNEIQTMAQKGEPIGDAVQLRLENHLRAAFQNAAELDDPGLILAMEKVRQQSQNQLEILNEIKQGSGSESGTNLDLAEQAIIRSRIQAEGALENPNTLRTRYGLQRNLDAPDQPEMLPPGEGQGEPSDGDGNSAGPSGTGEGNDGEPGPRRNGQSQ
jgi:hypothetical protein